MRTFISINLDNSSKEKIFDIQNEVKNQISLMNEKFLSSISWTKKEKFHLTLFFIGEVNQNNIKDIDEGLTNLQEPLLNEIGFKFKCFNAFPKLRDPRVLIIELMNEDKKVTELSEKINKHLLHQGFENAKQFHPHITLGRVRRDHKINLTGLENKIRSDLEFSVNEFFLMESKLKSTGPEYSVIKRYKT